MLPTENEHLPQEPVIDATSGDDRHKRDADPELRKDGLQGEGNYEAARAFNAAERKFVESGKVPAAARAAAPKSAAEQKEMIAAEDAGKRRAKKDDPAPSKPPRTTGTLSRRSNGMDKHG